MKLPAPIQKAILAALSERDETAEICRDAEGRPEPDPDLRDYENVPLPGSDDPADAGGVTRSVQEFFDREVKPHVPDTWINLDVKDAKDGRVGKIGYEINFNRYFYKYQPPRPLEEIEVEIRGLEAEILAMLKRVAV
jgi:type I restriction enzyme M protein